MKPASGAEIGAPYPILRFADLPDHVEVHLIDRPGQPFLGTGESAQGPTAAAIANAVANATGFASVSCRSHPHTRKSRHWRLTWVQAGGEPSNMQRAGWRWMPSRTCPRRGLIGRLAKARPEPHEPAGSASVPEPRVAARATLFIFRRDQGAQMRAKAPLEAEKGRQALALGRRGWR